MSAGGSPLDDESLVLLFHVHTHAHTHTCIYIYTQTVCTYTRTHTQLVTLLQHLSASTFTLICRDRVDIETFCFSLD